MLKERKVLEKNLIKVIPKLKTDKKSINDIKMHLANVHHIIDTQLWFNNTDEISKLDIRELILFAEQIFLKTGDLSINIDEFFTTNELKEAHQYSTPISDDLIELPYTIPNVLQLSNEEYVCILEASEINKLMKSNLLYYNMEIQREAKVVKKKDKVILTPTINSKSVKDITQNLINGKQFASELKLNCDVRTSDSGNELVYDPKHMQLTITSGTRISILDGAHRIKGIQNAFEIMDNIKQKFTVSITNLNVRQCQLMQSQIAKANKFSVQRIKELEQSRFSDIIVKQLKDESDLKISQTNRIAGDYMVSYNVIADTIDEEFKIETRADAADIGDFLVEYFNVLIGSYTDEFMNNSSETRKVSLINDNNFFIAYIVLARKLFEAKIKPKDIRKYIKKIDFNRENILWRELGILNDALNILDTNKARKAIRNYFEQIKL